MITRRTLFTVAVATGVLALAACGDDGGSSGSGLEVAKAWARQSPAATTAGAAYMDLTSEKADALVKVSVPTTIAAKAEIHETVIADPSSMTTVAGSMTETTMTGTTMAGSTMPAGGEMAMRPIDKLELPAGTTVSLKPGGYHIMLIGLAKPLEIGQRFDVTLTLESGATKTVSVEVREDAP